MSSYPESVRYLYAIGNEMKGAKLGLDRILVLLDALDNPQKRFRSIHVAGTNGKGSTCAMIAAGLWASGAKAGLYTSPHLIEPTERIQLGPDEQISPQEFGRAFEEVHRVSNELMAKGAIDHHPSYFESITAMAFLAFAEKGLEWGVIETGLGGRLDATNVLAPELCVITPIALDHQEFLGDTLQSIAAEKAGIFKPGVPVVLSRQELPALQTLLEHAARTGSKVLSVSDWKVKGLQADARGSRFLASGPSHSYRIHCTLAGEHQVENALTAVAALDALGLPRNAIERCGEASWPGRLEWMSEHPAVILDGAHNIEGAKALASYIRRYFEGRNITLIFGVMRDKDVRSIAELLFPAARRVILTAPHMARAMEPEAIQAIVDHPAIQVTHDLGTALGALQKSQPEDVIFITGSLYLVGEARDKLRHL